MAGDSATSVGPTFYICAAYFKEPTQPGSTGGTISNYHLANHLAKLGRTVVCTSDPDALGLVGENGFEVNVSHARLRPLPGRLRYIGSQKRSLEESVARYGRGIVIATSASIGVASELAFLHAFPLFLLVRAYEDFVFSQKTFVPNSLLRRIVLEILDGARTRTAFAKSSGIITNSEWMRESIRQGFPASKVPIHVLHPPMDLVPSDSVAPCPTRPVGFVNRGHVKGIGLVKELALREPDIDFVVFGEVPVRDFKRFPKNMSFKGWVADRYAIFGSISLLLVPSSWPEPFGRVAAEALSLGVPVLSSRTGGLTEVVANEPMLVDSFDVSEWQVRLRTLLDNYEETVKIARIRGATIRAEMCEEVHLSSLRSIFAETIKEVAATASPPP